MGERYILDHGRVDVRVLVLREYRVLVSSGVNQSFHFVENGNAWAHPERILDCENHENCTALYTAYFVNTVDIVYSVDTAYSIYPVYNVYTHSYMRLMKLLRLLIDHRSLKSSEIQSQYGRLAWSLLHQRPQN